MKTRVEVLEFIVQRITWSEGRIKGLKYRDTEAYRLGVEDVLNYKKDVNPFYFGATDYERYRKGYDEAFRALWRKS